jgi:hypothetical protein
MVCRNAAIGGVIQPEVIARALSQDCGRRYVTPSNAIKGGEWNNSSVKSVV